MDLNGKVVFITGSASGIGAACARAVLQRGANVVIADIQDAAGTELSKTLNAEFGENKTTYINCDVSKYSTFRESFDAAVEKYKHIDVMVNNAGVIDENNSEKVFHVNVKGVMLGTEFALSHIRKDRGGKGGVIINVASDLSFTPYHPLPIYVASKHAVLGYTRSLAATPDLNGVEIACLCPGPTSTPLFDSLSPDTCRKGTYDAVVATEPDDRTSPDFIAEGLLALLDDEGRNGTVMLVRKRTGKVKLNLTAEFVK